MWNNKLETIPKAKLETDNTRKKDGEEESEKFIISFSVVASDGKKLNNISLAWENHLHDK